MSDMHIFMVGLPALFLWMTALYAVQRARQDAGVVDLGWTWGLGFMAVALAVGVDGYLPRRALVAAMVGLWALRLGLYILNDRVRGRIEDARYRSLRIRWGRHAQLNFFVFFQAQALLVLLFAVPVWVVMRNPRGEWTPGDFAGVALWLAAVAGETVADRQLAAFRADPARRGGVCQTGLWRYSRHPNYFCEWLHWWAYVAMAAGTPLGGLALGPAVMLLFLFKLTGIPHAERQALARRGAAYREYQRTTPVFFPWFPRPSTPKPQPREYLV
jgi:steroid 5-alpha reductase family enzyme